MQQLRINTVTELTILESALNRKVLYYGKLKSMMQNQKNDKGAKALVDYASDYLNASQELLSQIEQTKVSFSKPIEVSDNGLNRSAFVALAHFLKQLNPSRFDMFKKGIGPDDYAVQLMNPMQRLIKDGKIMMHRTIETYYGIENDPFAWCWVFGEQWQYTDNTPEGCAQRIEFMLQYGVPKNWSKQMTGLEPITYKN